MDGATSYPPISHESLKLYGKRRQRGNNFIKNDGLTACSLISSKLFFYISLPRMKVRKKKILLGEKISSIKYTARRFQQFHKDKRTPLYARLERFRLLQW